jgi:phage gp16-like protein
MSAARAAAPNTNRAMIAKIHVAAKDMALADDTRRALMFRMTGKTSSADMDAAQLDKVLGEFKRLGWKAKPRGATKAQPVGRRPADTPIAGKARAMWISLFKLGVVRNSSEQALEAFAKRQLKVAALQWADPAHTFRLIEALKAMAEKAGWSQDVGQLEGAEAGRLLQARLDGLLEARAGR